MNDINLNLIEIRLDFLEQAIEGLLERIESIEKDNKETNNE